MELKFGNDIIEIDEVTLNLEEIDNKKLFQVLEKIIDNEDKIVQKKLDDISPLSNKFYEIFSKHLSKEEQEE